MRSKMKGTLWLAAGLLAAPFALAAASSPANAQAKELVIASWGDPYKAAWYKTIVPDFEKATGAKIVWSDGFSSQTLAKLRAQKDKPEIDVAMFDDGPYFQARDQGLCSKINFAKIPNLAKLPASAKDEGGMGIFFAATGTGIYYNEKIFKDNKWAPPVSWSDLFRPEFKKKMSAHNIANSNGLMLLLAMNDLSGGKSPDNMEPGFTKMKDVAERVVTFDQYGETPTLIQQELSVIGVWSQDRAMNLANVSGVPIKFVFPKEGMYGWREALCIPAGRPAASVELAYKFADMMLTKEQQEANGKLAGFIPFHPEVKGFGTPEEIARIKYTDWTKVNPHRPAWTERWAKEIERKK